MAAFLNRLGALQAGKPPVVNAAELDGLDSTAFLAVSDISIVQQGPWFPLLDVQISNRGSWTEISGIERTRRRAWPSRARGRSAR